MTRILAGDVVLLVAFLLLVLRIVRPWPMKPIGPVLRRHPVTFLGRLRMMGRQFLIVVGAGTVLWAVGLASGWLVLAIALCELALIVIPVHYDITAEGIRLGRLPLRRWTEFAGAVRQPWRVRLQGLAGNPPMSVWLSGSRDDDEFVQYLKRVMRGSHRSTLPAD